MKTTLLLLLALVLPLQAQRFTYESAAELSATLDAEGNGRASLLVVDKATGVRQLGLQQADGTFVWQTPLSTGLDGVSALTIGQFAVGSRVGFAVAAPLWNRVQVFPTTDAEATLVPPPGIGPNLVVALDLLGSAALDDLAMATAFDSPPSSTQLGAREWDGAAAASAFATVPEAGPLTRGNPLRFGTQAVLAAVRPVVAGSEFITRRPGLASFVAGPTVSNLPPSTAWAWGNFGAAGNATALFYTPGTGTLLTRPLTEPMPDVFAFGAGADFDLGAPIAQVFVVSEMTGALLLVLFADGATASTYDFDGTNAPTLRETLTAPADAKFSLAAALGNGHFLLLNGPSGGLGNSTGWQRWNLAGARHTLAASGALPAITPAHGRANVLVFTVEPALVPSATLVRVLSQSEWSVSSSFNAGVLEVTSERLRSPTLGLGDAATGALGTGLAGNFIALNQRGAAQSVALFQPPLRQPAADLAFSPPPGTYAPAAALGVRIDAPAGAPVYYRLNASQPWTLYDPANLPQVTNATTFSAYLGGSAPSPIRSATYSFAAAPAITLPLSVDANRNGIPDAWESLFGLTDPDGDADGDGFTNREEYLAGTDPLDPLSKPTPSDVASAQLLARKAGPNAPAGTRCEIVWPGSVIGAVLETRNDLTQPPSWAVVAGATLTTGNERVFYLPVASSGLRQFFRLRQGN